ncbi:SPOR domain-containing protein [Sphingomonas sp. MG17]|uniref:SPOR domain-containing protein n=1 Tax=Sphingomonas tagetis TaxID=2949092 RepID=A0A9X2KJ81_9SPHN|nr:SPOR domain-containing protein [Sphingomonas tagetis]MCP3729174.1 SPOR domain-containing protein [Sphingomonas tagetis]
MRNLGAVVLLAGIGLASLPALADVKGGVEAWQRGDYKKAIAEWRGPAVAGDPDAQFNLGQAYKLGRGVPADLAQAEQWYRKAALQGHPQAEENYGLVLFENNKRMQAAEWLQRAAARGEPRSQYVLGTMYFNGDGVEKDWVRAYALTVRASAQGLPQASTAQAQMDRYITLADRQKGLELARNYERDAGRPLVAAAPPPPRKGGPIVKTDLPPSTVAQRPIPVEPESEPQVAETRPAPPIVRPAPRQTPRPAPVQAEAPVRDGGWRVQIGAFGDPANARKAGGQAAGRFPGRKVFFEKAGKLTKVLVGPFGSSAEATRACGAFRPCVPVKD